MLHLTSGWSLMPEPLPRVSLPGVTSPTVASGLLSAAARDVDAVTGVLGAALPAHWRSPAARAYRRRLDGLVATSRRLSGLLDHAAAGARLHEREVAATRTALAGGGTVAV